MPLDFPSSRTNGQNYTFAGITWPASGTAWVRQRVTGPQGATGPKGATGPQGATGVGASGAVPEAPSDGTSYGRLNAAWVRVVNLAGDTMSGDLGVSKASPRISLAKAASG